jgi:hypothetical protein
MINNKTVYLHVVLFLAIVVQFGMLCTLHFVLHFQNMLNALKLFVSSAMCLKKNATAQKLASKCY